MSARASATHACAIWRVASVFSSSILRRVMWRHIVSNTRSQIPIQRMQWWILPGPSRSWAIKNPAPSAPSRLATGTRTFVYRISEWLL